MISPIGNSGFIGRYNYKPEGAIVKELSVRVPTASYSPASYELTVKKSMSTGIEDLYSEQENDKVLYDLQGRIMTGNVVPGVYILKSGKDVKKVIIR